MSGARHVPVRMCVGCGTRAPQANLLRFRSRVDGALVVVAARQQAGRTAYLHRQRSCWERFASRGGPLRSLRRTVDKPRRRAFVHEMQAAEQCAMVTEHGA